MVASQINLAQIICIFMLSMGLMNHVIVIPLLLDAAHRDAWISALLTLGALLVWLPLLYFIIKQSKQKLLFHWLSSEFSSIVAYVVAIIGTLLLLIISYMTLKDTVTFTTTTYLTATPNWAITLVLIGLCFYNAYYGIDSIARTAVIILPFVVVFGILVMISTMPHKDYSLLKPMLEHGWAPVWKGMVYAGAGYAEIILILFMQHKIQPKFSFIQLFVTALLAASLSIGPTIGAIVEFGPTKATQLRYPAFEQWRLIQLGTYIEHIDFLSVYQWMSGAFIRISLATTLIPELFAISHPQTRRWVLIVIYLAILLGALVPISDHTFLSLLRRFLLPFSLWLMLGFSLLLGALSLLSFVKKRRGM